MPSNAIKKQMTEKKEMLTGAQIVLRALQDQGVDSLFGYPGGAVLPIYDELFKQESVRHILVRHEQGAAHAAEGYARSSGKVGVVLVTSGPGATNTVTGLMDALMDSIPLVCITGQVPSHLIGSDAFQEADTTGITRSCTKHNFLVKDAKDLAETIHKAFHIARSGRPGPVVVDIPKDIQFADAAYVSPEDVKVKTYNPVLKGDENKIEAAIDLIASAKKPVFYTGGGIINAGPQASKLLRAFVKKTGAPITQTLMGLGAYPADDAQFLGMLGMHGTYEANMAMHDCDVMIAIGSRFDDRVTGNLKKFSPNSKKIHVDIDPSSINKTVSVDVGIVADATSALEDFIKVWDEKNVSADQPDLSDWWDQISKWRDVKSLSYEKHDTIIKPQFAIERLYEKTKNLGKDVFVTTEVGQHQMWAAQHFHFNNPNRWMTSGGLGTMGYGLPAAIGAQIANPGGFVVDIAGEASILMNIQEMSTAIQYRLPVKVFIINNQWMGMVRQWQELIHGERYSQSYTEALPDFVKLAEAYGGLGLRAENVSQLDGVIDQMIAYDGPVIADICVDAKENCFPMIPSGAAHCDMILGTQSNRPEVTKEGLKMV